MRGDFAGGAAKARAAAGILAADGQPNGLVLYSKPGCCLCEDVRPFLETLAGEHGLALLIRNILDDGQWYDAYRYRIPVVCYQDVVLGEGRVDLAALRTRLQRILRQGSALPDAPGR
jgi:hypothetical protein